MSSHRTHLVVSGAILRVRRYPRSSLPRAIAASHVTKPRLPQHTIRVCSSWRRGGPQWRGHQHVNNHNHGPANPEDEQHHQPQSEQGKHNGQQPQRSPWENQPYELSRREKMWRERMDRIRRMVEHDPYEALFGYSNRLLKGMRADWPSEQEKWWQKEMSFTVRNPFSAGPKKVEVDVDQPAKAAEDKQPDKRNQEATVKTKTPTASEVEPEPELEYDPISNRMVRKETKSSGDRYEQHTLVITPYNGNRQVIRRYSEHTSVITPEPVQKQSVVPSKDQAVDIPVKPWRAPPSFTMLKEDLSSEATAPKNKPEPITSARAEYEQYKAKRLSDAVKSKQWLKNEGFSQHESAAAELGSQNTLEKQFDSLHSDSQELAENKLLDKRMWTVQRSKGTHMSGASFAEWREKVTQKMGAYDETKADREIHEYTMQVAGDNLKNKRFAEESATTAQTPHRPLVHPAPDAKADKEVLDYAKQVASDNIKTKRAADRVREKEQTDQALAAMRRKQFEKFNKESREFAEQSWQSLEARTLPVRQGLREVKQVIQEAKEEISQMEAGQSTSAPPQATTGTKKPLETSLQRHQEKGDASTSGRLKTSLQRLHGETAPVATSTTNTTSTTSEQVRTHDPVGYNHARESRQLQRLSSEPKKPFKIPSLAEMFGYNKARRQNDASTTAAEKKGAQPPPDQLQSEIEAQKTAFTNFEASRKPVDADAKTVDVQAMEQKKAVAEGLKKQMAETRATVDEIKAIRERLDKDEEKREREFALVREIRHIYEDRYGPITTSHTQPVEVEASVEKVVEADAIAPTPTPAQEVETTEAPKATTEATTSTTTEEPAPKQEPASKQEPEPAAKLNTPTPAKTAKYAILAYDSKTKSMTTASFESIPSAPETSIPATIALRHLAYANRFLPKLIELQHRGFVPVHAERNLLILRQDSGGKSVEEKGFDASEDIVNREVMPEEDGKRHVKEPKRLEHVFSGAPGRSRQEKAWAAWKESRRQDRHRRRRRFRRAVKFVTGGVVLSGAVIYLAGVGAEVRHHRGRGKVVVTDEKRDS